MSPIVRPLNRKTGTTGKLALGGLAGICLATVALAADQPGYREIIQQFRDEGEPLTLEEFSLPIPDDALNFCAIPELHDVTLVDAEGKADPKSAEPRAALAALERLGPGDASSIAQIDFAAWVARQEPDPALPAKSSAKDAAQRALEILDRKHPVLRALANAATERRDAVFLPPPQQRPPGDEIPRLPNLNSAARALTLRAAAAAQAGQSAEAMRSVIAIYRLAQAAQNEPFFVGQLTALALGDSAHRALEMILGLADFTDAELASLQAAAGTLRPGEGLLRGYRGELVFLHGPRIRENLLREMGRETDLAALPPDAPPWASAILKLAREHAPEIVDLGMARTLQWDLNHQIRPLREGGLAGWNAHLRLHAEEMQEEIRTPTDEELAAQPTLETVSRILMGIATPNLSSVAGAACRSQARAQLAQIACGIRRHEHQAGRRPAFLQEIEPATLPPPSPDPAAQSPVHYRIEGDVIRLWYDGDDRRDDGGDPARDIVWILRPVETR